MCPVRTVKKLQMNYVTLVSSKWVEAVMWDYILQHPQSVITKPYYYGRILYQICVPAVHEIML